MRKIAEDTLLPISLVITLAGGVFWLSSMYSKVEAHEVGLTSLKASQTAFQQEVIDRLARIETALKDKQ
jgi:hypothetical protein